MAAKLTAVPTEQERDGASEEAWAHVMAGCADALSVDGLPPTERDRLVRCHRLAAQKAGRSHLEVPA